MGRRQGRAREGGAPVYVRWPGALPGRTGLDSTRRRCSLGEEALAWARWPGARTAALHGGAARIPRGGAARLGRKPWPGHAGLEPVWWRCSLGWRREGLGEMGFSGHGGGTSGLGAPAWDLQALRDDELAGVPVRA
jgi:hypothetical protein